MRLCYRAWFRRRPAGFGVTRVKDVVGCARPHRIHPAVGGVACRCVSGVVAPTAYAVGWKIWSPQGGSSERDLRRGEGTGGSNGCGGRAYPTNSVTLATPKPAGRRRNRHPNHLCGANTLRGLSNLPTAVGIFFTVGSPQGGTPRSRGAGNLICMAQFANMSGDGLHTYMGALLRNNAHSPLAPRVCGVLPCIKPTVKTVGASPHAYQSTERRRMAVWISANACQPTTFVTSNHCTPTTLCKNSL